MNRGEEDYIKELFKLEFQNGSEKPVSNVVIAQVFGHSPQTVSEMIKKLAAKRYIRYTPYKGSILTDRGIDEALKIIKKHRIWEIFLFTKLNYKWHEIHEEAERLEHSTSDKLLERLDVFLGHPQYCPHGNPIPDKNGISASPGIPLYEVEVGKKYVLKRVVDSLEVLMYLNKVGLKLGDKLDVVERDMMSEIFILQLYQRKIVLGFKIAKYLYVDYIGDI